MSPGRFSTKRNFSFNTEATFYQSLPKLPKPPVPFQTYATRNDIFSICDPHICPVNIVPVSTQAVPSRRWHAWACLVLLTLLLGIGLATGCSLAARHWWVFELLSHFRCQYAVITAVLLFSFATLKRAGFVCLAAAIFIANFWELAPFLLPAESTVHGPHSHTLRIVTLNLHWRNDDPQATVEFIHQSTPDIIVLEEVTENWQRVLQGLISEFPHQRISTHKGVFGIAILSRFPLLESLVIESPSARTPSILAKLKWKSDRVITVIASHTLPPTSRARARQRNAQLNELAALIQQQAQPIIVAGDLNITPWSPWFQDLLTTTKLQDNRKGFGIQATFPSWQPCLRIPIDHVLTSPEIETISFQAGPYLGSDHLPVVCDLRLP